MTAVASMWRESLLRSGSTGSFATRDLPQPPVDIKWDDASSAPAAVQMLCTCVAALTAETSRQVEDANRSDEAQELRACSSFIAALYPQRGASQRDHSLERPPTCNANDTQAYVA